MGVVVAKLDYKVLCHIGKYMVKRLVAEANSVAWQLNLGGLGAYPQKNFEIFIS